MARVRRPRGADVAIVVGVVVGWATSATALLLGFGSLNNPNQDWDYVFHANATRLIADSHDVAPAALRAINDWEVQTSSTPTPSTAWRRSCATSPARRSSTCWTRRRS